jgi:hypothetical protein
MRREDADEVVDCNGRRGTRVERPGREIFSGGTRVNGEDNEVEKSKFVFEGGDGSIVVEEVSNSALLSLAPKGNLTG